MRPREILIGQLTKRSGTLYLGVVGPYRVAVRYFCKMTVRLYFIFNMSILRSVILLGTVDIKPFFFTKKWGYF